MKEKNILKILNADYSDTRFYWIVDEATDSKNVPKMKYEAYSFDLLALKREKKIPSHYKIEDLIKDVALLQGLINEIDNQKT